MKFKSVWFLLAVYVTLLLNMTVFAAQPEDKVITDLYNFKIISDVSDVRADDNITRAETVKMLCIFKGFDNSWDNMHIDTRVFDDVPADHWAAKYIQTGVWENIINGYEDNTFKPENNVTNQELQKMIVCTLGYDLYCIDAGGYPEGYLSYARKLKISADLNLGNNRYATRGDAMQMIYNALDAPIMDTTHSYHADVNGHMTPEIILYDGGKYPFKSYRMILSGEAEGT